MVGVKDRLPACLALRRAQRAIAWNGGCLAHFGDRVGGRRIAIAVDHEARIELQRRGGIERLAQALGHARDANVPGDMAHTFGFIETERAEPGRNQPTGVIGGEEEGRAALGPQHAHWRRLVGRKQCRVLHQYASA